MVLQAVNEISTNRRQAIDILGVAAMRKHRSFADGFMGRDRRFEAAVLARAL
jgi:hypothetical protein